MLRCLQDGRANGEFESALSTCAAVTCDGSWDVIAMPANADASTCDGAAYAEVRFQTLAQLVGQPQQY